MDDEKREETLTIGNKSMDMEHRLQVGLVQAAEEAIAAGRPTDDVKKILGQLYEHSNAHFLAENLLMRLHVYPDYFAHSEEHDRFVAHLEGLTGTFESGDTTLMLESIGMLKKWLFVHIRDMDQRLSTFVAEHGVPIARRA